MVGQVGFLHVAPSQEHANPVGFALRSAMAIKKYSICLVVLSLFLAGTAKAQNCGWSKIDHQLSYDESGIWKPSNYRNLMNGLTIAQVVGALGEGSDSRLGLTMWQGIDSQIIGNVSSEIGKRIFRRERPAESNN